MWLRLLLIFITLILLMEKTTAWRLFRSLLIDFILHLSIGRRILKLKRSCLDIVSAHCVNQLNLMIGVPKIDNIYSVVKLLGVLVNLMDICLILNKDSIVFLLDVLATIRSASWFMTLLRSWSLRMRYSISLRRINFDGALLHRLVIEETVDARARKNWRTILKRWSLMPPILLTWLGSHLMSRLKLELFLLLRH